MANEEGTEFMRVIYFLHLFYDERNLGILNTERKDPDEKG